MIILMGRWIFGSICLVFTWPLLAKDFLNTNIAPEWSSLDSFQNRINRTDFEHLLTKVYCPRATWRKGWVELKEKEVWIRKAKHWMTGINFPLEMEIKHPLAKTVFPNPGLNFHYKDLPLLWIQGILVEIIRKWKVGIFQLGRALR